MSGHGDLLALFRRHGPLTRAQVVDLSGLARATATHRLEALVRSGLLRPDATDRSTGGRPAEVLDLTENHGSLLVADIGSSHARYGVADLSGKVLVALDEDIAIEDGPEIVLAGVEAAFTRLAADARPVMGAAIGVPGPVDQRTGRLVSPPTMRGWDGIDAAARIRRRFDVPIVVDKDANLVALGVHRSLRASGVEGADDLLVLKVGMGVGAGIISRGAVLHGARGGAGDLGHIPHADGALCRCGQRGCAEASAGGWAIAAHLRDLGHSAVRTSADVVALAASGDADAIDQLRGAGRRVGESVVEAVGVLNPAIVVVGGDLAESGALLVDGVRERVLDRSHPLATTDLQVIASPLGPDAGLLGAAQMAADAALSPARVDALVTPFVGR